MISHTLYTKDSKGATRFWEISSDLSVNEDGTTTINIKHGLQGSDKVQMKTRKSKPKNIGRANETTAPEQAKKDIESLLTAQKDKGYVTDISLYKEPFKPMLAHKWSDKSHTVKWGERGYWASPKLDGIRCFIIKENGALSFMSRSGKAIKHLKHIADEVLSYNLPDDLVLDGELYADDLPFNKISSLVNSEDYNASEDSAIQFHMYDCINLNHASESFPERLYAPGISDGQFIKMVPQRPVSSLQELLEAFSDDISKGYEGTMLKNSDPYVFGKRSNSLLKYKEMLDEEFLILDVVPSEQDPQKPKVLLKANNETGTEFYTGTIKGNKEEVYQMYLANKHQVIGKYMTVQYQTLSEYGVPLFPVGIGIREGTVVNGAFVPSV